MMSTARIGAERAATMPLSTLVTPTTLRLRGRPLERTMQAKTIGVGFDDSQQFGMGRGKAGKKTDSLRERGCESQPSRARCHSEWHWGRQRSVYGMPER